MSAAALALLGIRDELAVNVPETSEPDLRFSGLELIRFYEFSLGSSGLLYLKSIQSICKDSQIADTESISGKLDPNVAGI
jgi:hypothetical protein